MVHDNNLFEFYAFKASELSVEETLTEAGPLGQVDIHVQPSMGCRY